MRRSTSGSEAHLGDTEALHSEDQSYRETVHGIRSYMKWSFILDHEYVCPSRQDNPWMGKRSQPSGKVSVAMPAADWFSFNIEQMNLHMIQDHMPRAQSNENLDGYAFPPCQSPCLAPCASAIKVQGISDQMAQRIEAPQRNSTRTVCEAIGAFLGGLHVTNPPIRLMCPTSICLSVHIFVSGL